MTLSLHSKRLLSTEKGERKKNISSKEHLLSYGVSHIAMCSFDRTHIVDSTAATSKSKKGVQHQVGEAGKQLRHIQYYVTVCIFLVEDDLS